MRFNDLKNDTNKSIDVLRGDMNRGFESIDKKFNDVNRRFEVRKRQI
jgi:hypothetical protein